MKKLFCVIVFSAAIQSFSQTQERKFIETGLTEINFETAVIISDFGKINSLGSPLHFRIKTGSLYITVSGTIDNASSRITISLYAKEPLNNEMIILASKDSQEIQYKIEGAGTGNYGGILNTDDAYVVNTGFKIVAPGHLSYILVLPLNLRLSPTGNNDLVRCFIDGTAYLYSAKKKKNKKSI